MVKKTEKNKIKESTSRTEKIRIQMTVQYRMKASSQINKVN